MRKEHCNLFYIFQKDRAANPIPSHFLERLQKTLSGFFSPEKEKSKNNVKT